MKTLEHIKMNFDGKFTEASFKKIDVKEIEIYLKEWNNENVLLLYLESGEWKWVSEVTSKSICIPSYLLRNEKCLRGTFYIGNLRDTSCDVKVLRNLSVSIPEEAENLFFDRRALYANSGNDRVLPYYSCAKELSVEYCDTPLKKYWHQFLNEILYSETIPNTSDLCVCVECKEVLGDYVGLYVGDKPVEDDKIGEKCYSYKKLGKSDQGVRMEFCIPTHAIGKKIFIIWQFHGQYYSAPVEKRTNISAQLNQFSVKDDCEIQLSVHIPYIQGQEILGLRFVSEKNGWNHNVIKNISDFDLEYKDTKYMLKTVFRAWEVFDLFETWKIEIVRRNHSEINVLPVLIENEDCVLYQELNGKELFAAGDTTTKIVLKIQKLCLLVEHKYGHNVLFKKNCLCTEPQVTLDEFLMRPDIEPKGQMYGTWIQNAENVYIQLYQEITGLKEADLVMYHTQGMGIIGIQKLVIEGGVLRSIKLECPKIDQGERFSKPVNSFWFRVALALRTEKGIFLTFLKNYDLDVTTEREGVLFDERNMYLNPVAVDPICKIPMSVVPYYAKNHLLSVKYVRPEQRYRSQFCNELLDVRIKKNVLTIKVRCRDCHGLYRGILMEYRKVKEDDAQTYLIPYESLTEEKDDSWIMVTRIDMKKYYMRMLYWDIRVAFEIDGILYNVACYSNDKKFLKKYDQVFVDRTYPNKNSIMFPYATANQSVALMHRETVKQDHWRFRLKEQIAMKLYSVLKKYWDRKNIYLIFEKYCTMAQDNGYFFFKYCMDADVEKNFDGEIYYVLDREAADWCKVQPYRKHVIRFLSLKHLIYLQACKLMISTDTKGHAYVWRSMGSAIKKLSYKKKLVFLQHGVTAFKRGHFERGTNVGCESFITTSQFEHDIIRNYLGYTEEEVPVTGFARWDVLHDKSQEHREILMMPTWRSWLDDAENDVFAESDYCKNYMALLNNPKLDEILKAYDVTLNFYLHPKFRKFITEFSVVSDNIRLIPFGEEPLNELMMQCNLLITDFSSVAWDVYYMKKPVLFYHFDIEDASKTLGFYMDMKNDLFGERAEKPDELMDLIVEYIQNDFQMKEKYKEQHGKYFAYVDDNNSERIWNAIRSRDWERS